MRVLVKKFFCIILSLLIFSMPAISAEKIKTVTNIQHDFCTDNVPKEVLLKTSEDINISEEVKIPADSIVHLEVMQTQKERRWHKSGFILCKLIGYNDTETNLLHDLSNEDIYFAARKYVKLDKKEASILTSEIILTQAASIVGSCFIIFAPVDIAYFFIKGAIQREKNPNWFKAGVSNAYDNSICWFWLKGKPIELESDETVKIKSLKPQKAHKLKEQIDKRQNKQSKKLAKKQAKIEKKSAKKQVEAEKKIAKNEIKEKKKRLKKMKKDGLI